MIDIWLRELDPLRVTVLSAAGRLVPRLAAALLTIVLAIAVAKTARWLVRRAARTEWLGRWLRRSGVLSGLAEPSLVGVRRFIAGLVYWCMLLAGALLALAILSERSAVRFIALLMVLLPNLLIGVAIIAGTWWLSRYCARGVLIRLTTEGIAWPWRWATLARGSVFAAGVALASEVTGFATPLIRPAFLILLSGATFAVTYACMPLLRRHMASRSGLTVAENAHQSADDALLR